ncbi:MAG: peptidoglycan bridge formation glycyltransferase FemA/FemB family protein [Patescibacteria group bacterium]|jgi:lipid II:glycine glycyltransferase (peptidoglycan interpeptide bridge formation enzyme)
MSSIFQSPEWEKFKLATGYSKSFRVEDILVLKKDLPMGRSMLYSPMASQDQISNVKNQSYWNQTFQIAKEENAIFYRIEFDIPTDYELQTTDYGLIKSFEEMQPEHTLVLDLSKSNDDLLGEMKQKGRYNIKVAEKNNILVRKTRDASNFYKLYEKTGKRHGITFRGEEYFQKLLDFLEPKGYCELFEAYAEIEGEEVVLAAAICSIYQGSAIYLFGASSDEFKNLMAPYKLQWEMIQNAISRGCKIYDFFGIAPDDNPRHLWAGVTRFKKQFGGDEVKIMGSYDKVYKPFEYQLFKIAEKIRR